MVPAERASYTPNSFATQRRVDESLNMQLRVIPDIDKPLCSAKKILSDEFLKSGVYGLLTRGDLFGGSANAMRQGIDPIES